MKRVVALLTVLVVAGGCALGEALADYGEQVPMTASMLVGTWFDDTRRVIDFHADGTMVANDLPEDAVGDYLPAGNNGVAHADAMGTWVFNSDGEVELTLAVLMGKPARIEGLTLTPWGGDGVVAGLRFYDAFPYGTSFTFYRKIR